MQSQSNVKEPDYGCLLDDTMFADGAEIPVGTFTVPRVEVELAFILSKRLQQKAAAKGCSKRLQQKAAAKGCAGPGARCSTC
jgi:2-keto-4-pentenoate hydratase